MSVGRPIPCLLAELSRTVKARVSAQLWGDTFARAYALCATRAAHPGMKHVKVENSTLWSTLLWCPKPSSRDGPSTEGHCESRELEFVPIPR